MAGNNREVCFALYCPKCANKELEGYKEPCNECLSHPFMVDSRKPLNFKEITALKNDRNKTY